MGHQQLLLIILVIVVVLAAIVIGINLFNSNSVESNRDQIISNLVTLSADAQAYYKKQTQYGGGAGSYEGWTIPDYFSKYESGKIKVKIKQKGTKVVLIGTGIEKGKNGNRKVRIKATVTQSGTTIDITN